MSDHLTKALAQSSFELGLVGLGKLCDVNSCGSQGGVLELALRGISSYTGNNIALVADTFPKFARVLCLWCHHAE